MCIRMQSEASTMSVLLQDDGEESVVPSNNSQRTRERLRGSKAELSWLMHTTYLSADTGGQAAKGIGEKHYKTMRDAAAAQPSVDDREAQIASIEVLAACTIYRHRAHACLMQPIAASTDCLIPFFSHSIFLVLLQASFEAAKQLPVHQKNFSLRPVEILPGERERGPGSNNCWHRLVRLLTVLVVSAIDPRRSCDLQCFQTLSAGRTIMCTSRSTMTLCLIMLALPT